MAAVAAVGRGIDSNMQVASSGSVYVFSSNGWNWKYTGTRLKSDYTDDGYGHGLSIGDGIIAVGAPYDSRWVEKAGVVYLYLGVAPTITSTMTLFAEHTDKEALFGASVAIVRSEQHFKNGAVIVGAPGDGHGAGSVYVYSKDYGSAFYRLYMKLEPSDKKDGGNLGYSLASYGNTLVVGAPGANSAYIYELLLHVEDCPHEHDDHQNVPEGACLYRRMLQGGAPEGEGKDGDGKNGEDGGNDENKQEREQQEREERERQEREENRRVYYTWKYDEILHVHLEAEENRGDMFGSSVAIYNDTVVTVVVGAPSATSASSSATDAGAVYVLTMMNKNDMWSNYKPEGYDEHHHLRRLEGHEEHDDHHHTHWDPSKKIVGWDSMHNFWLREITLYGESQGGRFGYAVAADYKNMLIGSNSEYAFGYGSVTVYQRQATNSEDFDRPLSQGPLYKRIFVKSGALSDSRGNKGDKFGSALSLHGNEVLVGSYLKGLSSATSVGTGAAYIYKRIKWIQRQNAPVQTTSNSKSSSFFGGHIDMSRALEISLGISLFLIMSVLAAYGVYKHRGGKVDAVKVFGSSWESVKEYISSWKSDARRSSMDDSTTSQTPMNEYMDSSRDSASSMSSTSSGSRMSNTPPTRHYPQQGGLRPQQPRGQPSYPLQSSGQQRQFGSPPMHSNPSSGANRYPQSRSAPPRPQRPTPPRSGLGGNYNL